MTIIADLARTAAHADQFPCDRLPEIALAGRSNVGKSSLINCLLGKKGLAHTSNTPGRTQTLNFYRVQSPGETKPFYLVDMPGYGFAQVSKSVRAGWSRLIEEYLESRDTLCAVIQIVDLRHPPQPLDKQMTSWLRHRDLAFLLVTTKADKIAKTKTLEHQLVIAEQLNVDTDDTLVFSAETGQSRDALWRWVKESIRSHGSTPAP